jgi:Tol biopolymer transport system component
VAFTDLDIRQDVWSIGIDLDRGTPKGALQRVTQGPAGREYVVLSKNGRYVVFSSTQSGWQNIWIRDLATGKESVVASSSTPQRFPVSDAAGTRIAFSAFEAKRVIYVAAPGGVPEKLCDSCLRATDWSLDEKSLLTFGGNPYEINVVDLASRRATLLLKHPTYSLLYGRYSPDGRWITFTVRTDGSRGHIAIAPLDGPKPVPESAWITIAESGLEDWANWSPDGHTLYFTSMRDGHSCLWAQRLSAADHHPAGDAFPVLHLHGRVTYQRSGWSAAGGRIAMVLLEQTGNIWMMSRSKER